MAGAGGQDEIRARLLGSLCRAGEREVTFLRVLPAAATDDESRDARLKVQQFAEEQAPERFIAAVVPSERVADVLIEQAAFLDLLIMGMTRLGPHRKVFGELTLRIARDAPCATILLSRRG